MTGPEEPLVSVLLPVFDGEATVERALEAALGQDLGAIEVLAVDDASRDRTPEILARAAAADPRILPLRAAANGGPGAARAMGLAAARGRWIAILDADDGWEPDRLSWLIGAAEAGGLDAIADNLALVDPGIGQRVGTAFPLGESESLEITPARFLANTRPGRRVNLGWMQPLVRRDFLLRHAVTWPALRHGEDMVFAMRLLMAGAGMRLMGRAGYLYTQRRGTVTGMASTMTRTRRSAAQQLRAVAMIREEAAGRLGPAELQRLRQLPGEIAATTHALELRDALAGRAWGRAGAEAAGLLAHPLGFLRCAGGRWGPGARRLV